MRTAGIILSICLLFSFYQEKTILDIEINSIRKPKGVIILSIYTGPEQYPYHPARTYVVKKDSLTKGILQTSIKDLSPGEYGLCLLDDENQSGEMENNMIGMPTEGFGFANNVKPFLKRPEYDRIIFKLLPGKNRMQLIVRYKN
ncbi:MAG: DUF2141 domain-containing protein [Bacteroidia bacterium]|nr:DUF2141 domain-containing protein [Bacteroidia bacterium]